MNYQEITYKDFANLAQRRGHTAESLAGLFRGKIDDPREYFERVLSGRLKGEDRSAVVIPYRSVIEFYQSELHYFGESNVKQRRCACGCGRPVFDRKKWASAGCRKKNQRQQKPEAA